jgi:hypothetical protein
VIILRESGGVADVIAALSKERPDFIEDPALAEIIVDGKFYFVQSTGQSIVLSGFWNNYSAGMIKAAYQTPWNWYGSVLPSLTITPINNKPILTGCNWQY